MDKSSFEPCLMGQGKPVLCPTNGALGLADPQHTLPRTQLCRIYLVTRLIFKAQLGNPQT